jgi:hypothetical protein
MFVMNTVKIYTCSNLKVLLFLPRISEPGESGRVQKTKKVWKVKRIWKIARVQKIDRNIQYRYRLIAQ